MISNTWDARAQVVPYEGEDNYIFISYSHQDMSIVLPFLQRLQEAGIRFWYDEGIDPGSEWPESIAAHLNGCRGCLAFISQHSLTSQNCRREINFALSRNKEFLSVILGPVEMSLGMEMQISSYQSIMRYKYRSDDQFLDKLLNVEMIANCREVRRPEAPADAAKAEEPAADAEELYEKSTQSDGGTVQKGRNKLKTGKKLWGLLGIAAVLIMIAVVLSRPSQLTINGQVYLDDHPAHTVSDAALAPVEMKKLSRFRECGSLSFINCTLESGALTELSAMEQLSSLTLDNCQGDLDLAAIGGMPNLKILTITNCGLTDQQIAAFSGEKLNTLDLSGNKLTAAPDIASLPAVTKLSLAGNEMDSLESLVPWTSLQALDVSGTGIRSLAGLEGHQNLKKLYAANNQISDLEALRDLIFLTDLDLSNNDITSLSPLIYCQQLTAVSLRGNQKCGDLETLSASGGTLKSLDLSGITGVESPEFFQHFAALTRLYWEDGDLTSCAGLERCVSLECLSLPGNQISDISSLANLDSLVHLNLSDNLITELPDLGHISAEASFPVYVLSNNQLSSLKNLPELKYFVLMTDGNPLTDLSALSTCSGTQLAIDCLENTPLEQLTSSDFTTLYITALHISKQAQLESSVHNIKYVSPLEAYEAIAGSYF